MTLNVVAWTGTRIADDTYFATQDATDVSTYTGTWYAIDRVRKAVTMSTTDTTSDAIRAATVKLHWMDLNDKK